MHPVERNGDDPAADAQDLARFFDGFIERAGRLFKRGKKKVAEAMTFEISALETVIHEFTHQLVGRRKRDQAAHDIAGR